MRRKSFNAIMMRPIEFKTSVHSGERSYIFFLLYLSLSCSVLSCVQFSHLKHLSENATGSREEERRNGLQHRQLIEQFCIAGVSKHGPAGATTFSLSHGEHWRV